MDLKVNQFVCSLLVSLIVLTIFVPPTLCQRRQRVRGHGKSHKGINYAGRQNNKRSASRYICEETEEDIERLKTRVAQCKCPSTYAPVCGSDGHTYHNRCFIHCAAEEKYQRFHRGRELTIAKMAEC